MKKITIAILLCGISSLILAQDLPNVGFENWSTEFLYEGLDQWKNSNSLGSSELLGISKSTDAYSGDYSVKLQSVLQDEDSIFNFFYHGTVTEGPTGGMAYSEEFDQVKGFYKCNMPEVDSASIYIIKWYGVSAFEMVAKVGGVHDTWTEFTIDVVGGTCDSVFIGFISSDVILEANIEFDSWVMFDSVYFNNTLGDNPSAIPNHDMEDWVDYDVLEIDDWYTVNSMLYSFSFVSVAQSEDAYAGTYSAQLTGFGLFGDNIPGYLSLGEITFDDENPFLPVAYTFQPTYLTGYYKYFPSGEDNAIVLCQMNAGGEPVGGNMSELAAASEWTFFEIPLNYSDVPEDCALLFSTGDNSGSVLYLDEVNFDFSTSVEDVKNNEISVYPNPSSDYVFVTLDAESNSNIQIYDVQGKLVKSVFVTSSTTRIDLAEFTAGLYYIRTDGNNSSSKLLVK